jgi:hypothetical protein
VCDNKIKSCSILYGFEAVAGLYFFVMFCQVVVYFRTSVHRERCRVPHEGMTLESEFSKIYLMTLISTSEFPRKFESACCAVPVDQ